MMAGFGAARGQTGGIILHDEKLQVTPREFYINDVVDERDTKNAVAMLLPAVINKNQPKTIAIDFEGGGLVATRQFIKHSMPQDTALRPIIVGLKKFMAVETARADGRVDGQVAVVMSFSLLQPDTVKQLLNYVGSTKYTRNPGPPQDIEPTLRRQLINSLVYLNTWLNRQAATNITLARSVKVNFTDHAEKTEGDSIYYSPNRKLTWDDFLEKVPQSRYAAEVSPTIGYNEQTKVAGGVIYITLDIKVCLPKSACWVKDGAQDAYTLNHEQRHFDLARISAERFKEKVKAEVLTVTDPDGPINVDYLDAYRDMDSLQKQYDKETNHGTDRAGQQRWNEWIDKQLKAII